MARFQIHKVTALPSPLEAHAIYLVTSGTDYVEIYVTGASASTVRRHINEADVQSLIDAAVGGLGAMDIVDDIAARDALDLSENAIVLVLDASADATISSGAATYAYRASPDLWVKISEAESMDLALTWASLSGKPSSVVAEIDDAVAKKHSHANKTQLDKIDEVDGQLTYAGSAVSTDWATIGW